MDTFVASSFEEYISKRCEEIILSDGKYQKFNNEILELEMHFKGTLNPDQKKEYNAMEESLIKSINYLTICVYKTCIGDIKEAKNRLSWF